VGLPAGGLVCLALILEDVKSETSSACGVSVRQEPRAWIEVELCCEQVKAGLWKKVLLDRKLSMYEHWTEGSRSDVAFQRLQWQAE